MVLSSNILGRGIGFTSFIVYYTNSESDGIAVCSSKDSLGGPATILSIIMNASINGILLYMFIQGLWSLNQKFLENYLAQQMQNQTADKPDNDTTDTQCNDNGNTKTADGMKVVIDKYKSDGRKSDSDIIDIIDLYNLMKKQAILVGIAVTSTSGIGIAAIFKSEFFFEMGWDAALNGICLWMTLSTSKRYWNFCRDYGICRCCHIETGTAK